jgi:hypothetical protein
MVDTANHFASLKDKGAGASDSWLPTLTRQMLAHQRPHADPGFIFGRA